MIIFPHKTDSVVQKFPFVNIALTLAVLTLSILFYLGKLDIAAIEFFMLSKWNILKLLGTILIQPDIISIIGIALFLLLIGNSINSILGNIYYLIVVVIFSAVSSSVHLLTGTIPAIGAHGMISALAGFALMILPSNKLIFYKDDSEDEYGINISLLVLFWIIFDVYSIIEYGSIVIVWAHLTGFAAGIVSALLFIKTKSAISLNPTFAEWLHDKFIGVSLSEIFTMARKEKADVDIKTKAGRLLKMYDVQYDNPEEGTVMPAEPENPTEPIKPQTKFRLLKAVKQKDHITLYIVYSGESISDISIQSDKYKCELYPTEKLVSGDSGSIKIYSKNFDENENIQLTLRYFVNGLATAKEIVYYIAKNEIGN